MSYEKPFALIGVGVPGSGKTTLLRPYADSLNAEYLSADDERGRLGDVSDQSLTPKAWAAVHEKAEIALRDGRSIVIDGTFAKELDRRREISGLRGMGARAIVALYFPMSLEAAMERIAIRVDQGGRDVPRYAVERMAELLEQSPPSHKDGFDEVVTIEN